MYRFLFTIVFFGKRKRKHSQILSHFENESTFWKRPHFENENIFLEKWKVINPFLKKLQLAKSIKKGSRMFVGAKWNWLIISNPEFFSFES